MILGMISVPKRMEQVMISVKIQSFPEPKISLKEEPATTDPPVLAMVLKIRMAAMGLLMFLRSFFQVSASFFSPGFSGSWIGMVTLALRITASASEQKNDIVSTSMILVMKSPIAGFGSFCCGPSGVFSPENGLRTGVRCLRIQAEVQGIGRPGVSSGASSA